MKVLVIKSYNTGEVLARKKMPKAEGRSITYGCEYIGGFQYMVVRDYHTNEILHKFKKSGTKRDCSIEFYVINEWED